MATNAGDVMRRHRLSVDDYHRMAEAGILGPNARVELIEGEIVDMAPNGKRHASTVAWLSKTLHDAAAHSAIVWIQNPIRLDAFSELQPDLALLRYREDFYAEAHPGPQDVLLLIEVADSSLPYDRQIKLPLYARHGIPEVWLVDLENKRLLRYLDPAPEGYRTEEDVTGASSLRPARLPEIKLDLRDLLSH